LGASWEQQKIQHLHPLLKENKKVAPMGASCLTSLAARVVLGAYLGSLPFLA